VVYRGRQGGTDLASLVAHSLWQQVPWVAMGLEARVYILEFLFNHAIFLKKILLYVEASHLGVWVK
jgi:hypothetical protein